MNDKKELTFGEELAAARDVYAIRIIELVSKFNKDCDEARKELSKKMIDIGERMQQSESTTP